MPTLLTSEELIEANGDVQYFWFWYKVVKQANGCWTWTGCTHRNGYGATSTKINGKNEQYTHRLAWMLINGCPIPKGMLLHHVCKNKICVSPAHLEPVTYKRHKELHPRVRARAI